MQVRFLRQEDTLEEENISAGPSSRLQRLADMRSLQDHSTVQTLAWKAPRTQRGLQDHSTVPDSRLESSADRGACRTTAQSRTLAWESYARCTDFHSALTVYVGPLLLCWMT